MYRVPEPQPYKYLPVNSGQKVNMFLQVGTSTTWYLNRTHSYPEKYHTSQYPSPGLKIETW